MALFAFEALAFAADLTVYFPGFLDFLSLEDVFAVIASYVLILVGLKVFAYFQVAHFVEFLLR